MILMPIVYVREMDESVAFYERLGFEVDIQSRSQHWTELKAGDGAVLALHSAEAGKAGRVELSMVAEEPLERLADVTSIARGIADEAFGRSIILRDPNGLEIQVNEHDRELYA
ncbi:MAG TPA: VOC family protein [Gaiellaceae bacterium]|nr:VOC family protein [Gaiellaceae bacterium]